ncbi:MULTISPECIES: helix-turn-helix domain-containing protein [Moraxella]|uniref:Bacteriophage CI repressor N-terminal domain-containing protein n=1 Tax=Moraxella catarrhalis TaxID=480 RepID=A0A7Z0UXZ9_MORCA|nr:helix-turn-helix domain-containing protein [Moraxella catarrhalis]OAV00246.1 hypothetical protein AO382_1396 [Moraxella catarrhalis]STY82514.1 Uncharacterised protein [Moraxella catarrhalis]
MTVDDLKEFFQVIYDSELTSKLGVSKGTISNWRAQGIPSEKQAMLQVQTEGRLQAKVPPLGSQT